MVEVGFTMGAGPAVIEIRSHAAARVMERKHRAAVVVAVGIAAREIASRVHAAAQAVYARMVIFAAAAIVSITVFPPGIVIWAARRIGQRAEIVIERMVLLHDDDYVFSLMRIAFGHGCNPHQQHCK